jgi:isochorismate synthase EntC
MQEEAKSILRVFLSKDRAWSIQLPRALLNRVAENVETDSTNICPHVFDEAREFLLDMLRDGIWKRFLASKLYRAFRKEQWAEKAKEEATRKVQERLEVMVIRRHDAVEENLFEIPERLAVETHHQLIAVDERDGVKIENYRRLDQGSVRQMTRQDCCQL